MLEVALAPLDRRALERATLWLPLGWLGTRTRLGARRIQPSQLHVRGEAPPHEEWFILFIEFFFTITFYKYPKRKQLAASHFSDICFAWLPPSSWQLQG